MVRDRGRCRINAESVTTAGDPWITTCGCARRHQGNSASVASQRGVVANRHTRSRLTIGALRVEIDAIGSVGDAGGHPVTSFREWDSEVGGVLVVLIDVLNACHRSCTERCSTSLGSHADQLRAASRDVDAWLASHAGPYPDLNVQLARVARSFSFLGTSLDVLTESAPTVCWKVIDRELSGLHTLIQDTLQMMNEWSTRHR